MPDCTLKFNRHSVALIEHDAGPPRRTRSGPSRRDFVWIGVQTFVLLIAVFGGLAEVLLNGRSFTLVAWQVGLVAGVSLILLGIYVLTRAVRDLSDNLTAAPTPVEGGTLVEHGVYRVVRHPMYSGLLAGMFGYSLLLGSWLALASTLFLVPFFFAKSSHEERLLRTYYPGYSGYTSRTRRRFIPWIL
jgi:protein-S-isoprenylcysteine O-methyltransferase Ste14